ncbi:MAG: HlyD family secretion protein [Caulobacteraceae bacterium]|nr:HlyD family secretion protein [Caulobacteraceae bacterium]
MDARSNNTDQAAAGEAPAAKSANRRRQLFTILGAVIVAGALLYGVYWVLVASHHVSTDDSYVNADVAQVTPLVAGAIVADDVTDTQPVKQGQVLVQIDPSDFKLTLANAEAALGQAQRKVQGYFANNDAQAANIAAREADVTRAKADLVSAQADAARATVDLDRRKALAPAGAVSADELTAAQDRYDQTEQAVASARAAIAQAEANRLAAIGQQKIASALTSGTEVGDNPEVAAAQAKVDQAKLDLDRTVVRSPVDGVVAKNVVEVGQRVQVGSELMTIVPVQSVYVDANFKEVQLRHVRLGQPAVLTSDLYGHGVKFHGHVIGLAGGTGSAFAVIPAQNATGNWVKVVQRLPVRIGLDPDELRKHPLRVGLSMTVDIDTAG